ncbi:MAG: efflux RND transporter periplasmic adaptor subunit [Pseudomonadota bacterium]
MRFPLLALLLWPALSYAQPLVGVSPVADVAVAARYEAQAEVVSPNQSQISAEVTGVVLEVLADVADTVEAGQVLVRLDPADLELELAQATALLAAAEARRTQAQARLERAQQLSDSQYISDDDLLERQTEVSIQAADVRRLTVARSLAQRRLDDATIRAPFAAAITRRDVQVGQLLAPGSPVLSLVQLTQAEILAQIPGTDRNSIRAASRLELRTDSGRFPLRLLSQAPVIMPGSRTSPARLAFVAAAEWPGATGTLIWEVPTQRLPADLVVRRNQQLGVFVLEGSTVRFVALPDAQEGRPAPHDLAPEDQVVVSGQQRLNSGDTVQVLP